jgi:hypothetical protein
MYIFGCLYAYGGNIKTIINEANEKYGCYLSTSQNILGNVCYLDSYLLLLFLSLARVGVEGR